MLSMTSINHVTIRCSGHLEYQNQETEFIHGGA